MEKSSYRYGVEGAHPLYSSQLKPFRVLIVKREVGVVQPVLLRHTRLHKES